MLYLFIIVGFIDQNLKYLFSKLIIFAANAKKQRNVENRTNKVE